MTSKNAITTTTQDKLENFGELKESVALMLSIVQRMITEETAKAEEIAKSKATKKPKTKTKTKSKTKSKKQPLTKENTLNYGKSMAWKKDWYIVGLKFNEHPELNMPELNISSNNGKGAKAFIRNSGFMSEDSVKQFITEKVLVTLAGFKLGVNHLSPSSSFYEVLQS